MTNGDIIIKNFNPYKVCEHKYSVHVYMTENDFINAEYQMSFDTDWWNSEYKEQTTKNKDLGKIRAEIDLDARIQVKHYTNTDAVIDAVLDVFDDAEANDENPSDNIYLDVAKEVLTNYFDESQYSLGTRKEGATCIEKFRDPYYKWVIYECVSYNDTDWVEAGEEEYITVVEALMDMFDRMPTDDFELIKKLKEEYFAKLASKINV